MDKFYKQLKHNLESLPEPEYEPRLWKRLNSDLDAQNLVSGYRHFWLFGSVASLLVLLIAFGVLFNSLSTNYSVGEANDNRAAYLEEAIDTGATSIKPEARSIENEVSLSEEKKPLEGNKGDRTMGGWSLKSKNFVEDHSKEVVLEQLDHEEYEINEKAAAVNKAISNLNEPIILNGRASFLPTSLSPLKIPTNREIDLDAFRVQGVSGKKSFINASELFRLEKTGLGAALGWGFMVNRLTEESWSYKAEIQFSGNFSNNFQFRVGLGQLKVGYFSEQMDDAIGVPDLSPPSETFKFVGAEVNQVRMEYTLGLNYLITTKQKWRPFVGIAYANKFATTYRVGYKFEDLTSDQNWELASEVEGKRIPGAAIILKAGLEYEIGKKLMMQIQGDLRRGLKSKDLELPALVMVQAGLNYRF